MLEHIGYVAAAAATLSAFKCRHLWLYLAHRQQTRLARDLVECGTPVAEVAGLLAANAAIMAPVDTAPTEESALLLRGSQGALPTSLPDVAAAVVRIVPEGEHVAPQT